MGGIDGAGLRARSRRYSRCVEAGDGLPHLQFPGARRCFARAGIFLHALPGEDREVVMKRWILALTMLVWCGCSAYDPHLIKEIGLSGTLPKDLPADMTTALAFAKELERAWSYPGSKPT